MIERIDTTARFKTAYWFEEASKTNVLIAGLGGIGSNVAYNIGRIHPNSIALYDDDIIEEVNLSGQFYGLNNLGEFKVSAMTKILVEYCNYHSIVGIPQKYETTSLHTPEVMICGFDNMPSRTDFFNKWLGSDSKLFIDGRMSAEYIQVFALEKNDLTDINSMNNINTYRSKYLFSDYQAEESVCSYKQTTFAATMIGSIITNIFINYCSNKALNKELQEGKNPNTLERPIPLLTTYDASTMFFQTIE